MVIFYVGLGGALGAICRYGLSLIPVKGAFPVMTLLTNLIGAIVIGMVVEFCDGNENTRDWVLPFVKTGFCGGFTTFSTFSLEATGLFEQGKYGLGTAYAVASVVICVAGVTMGRMLVRKVRV